jgi:uncharacterized protein YeaO (DUF488 family)
LQRVHDADRSGYRVLVDRSWPRGVTRIHAALDEWRKDAAHSDELRRWYGHLVELADERAVTLLTATRDVEHSGAPVLHEVLTGRMRRNDR